MELNKKEDFMKSMLGTRICALRKEKNTTQEELGKAIGVTLHYRAVK